MSEDTARPVDDGDEDAGMPVEEGAPLWMATFGDMMSLLLCFFILMFSMSELKMERFALAAQSMNQAMGSTSKDPVETPMGLMVDPADPDLALENAGMNDGVTESIVEADGQDEALIDRVSKAYLEMIAKRLQEFVDAEGLSGAIDVEQTESGVYLRMRATAVFPAGQAAPRVEGTEIVQRLAGVTASLNVPVNISGHADDQPISTPAFPSNWELSAARAAGVARVMIGAGQPPVLTKVESFGEFDPIADNATAEGRAQNRRVELYYSLEAIRASMDRWAESGQAGMPDVSGLPSDGAANGTRVAPGG